MSTGCQKDKKKTDRQKVRLADRQIERLNDFSA